MFAIVQDETIVSYPNGNKGITIGDVQYPQSIFTLWTEAERNAIGIYTVEIDNTNFKDEAFFINTNQTIAYDSSADKVQASYGTATAKPLDDVLWAEGDSDMPSDVSVGDIKQYGLKGLEINKIKSQASGLLAKTDWQVIKATEVSDYNVPTNISTYRANVRAKSNEMETQINACSDVDALKTLFTWTTDSDGKTTRPLASFPEEL